MAPMSISSVRSLSRRITRWRPATVSGLSGPRRQHHDLALHAEVPTAAPAGDPVAPRRLGPGDPDALGEVAVGPHAREHGRDAGELVPLRERPRDERDPVAGGAAGGVAEHAR